MGRISNWLKGAWTKVKGVGKKVIGAVKKVAPIVGKVGGVVGGLVSKIPHPIAKGIGHGLQVASGVANAVSGGT